MRKYKFRGKRVDNGAWVYGDLIENQGRYFIYHATSETTIEDNDDRKITIIAVKVESGTVGQFTGLPDKNGKEIYVGDIVRNKKGTIDVITYDSLAFALCVAYATSPNGVCSTFFGNNNPLKDLEVIGNIHDNPELLKGASNE
ncbi:MAG: hypothetical protein J6C81_06515 [Muribaculaceae bacterium]|nr:hypothetical protein [Muribaculaceae bacterium]